MRNFFRTSSHEYDPGQNLYTNCTPKKCTPSCTPGVGQVDLALDLVNLFKSFKKKGKGEFVIGSKNRPRYDTSRANYRGGKGFSGVAHMA